MSEQTIHITIEYEVGSGECTASVTPVGLAGRRDLLRAALGQAEEALCTPAAVLGALQAAGLITMEGGKQNGIIKPGVQDVVNIERKRLSGDDS